MNLDASVQAEDPVRAYLNGIGKIPLLDAAQEVELAKQIESGLYAEAVIGAYHIREDVAYDVKVDKTMIKKTVLFRELSDLEERDLQRIVREGERAKGDMIEANLRLVVSMAKRYSGNGMPLLDIIQEGNLGLIRAVEKFDYTKGYKFSTYATWWIRQAITRALLDKTRTIHLPVHLGEDINKMKSTAHRLLQELGREPTAEEIAKELSIGSEKVVELQGYAENEPVSYDMLIGDDAALGDVIEDEQAVDPVKAVVFSLGAEALNRVIDTLDGREADVLRRRFGLYDGRLWTLEEIGSVYGVTREIIRRREGRALAKLRHPSRTESYDVGLGQ